MLSSSLISVKRQFINSGGRLEQVTSILMYEKKNNFKLPESTNNSEFWEEVQIQLSNNTYIKYAQSK